MSEDHILLLSKLSEGIKTNLYEFFNKRFVITRVQGEGSMEGVRRRYIRFKKGGKVFYSDKFNCGYLLEASELPGVEPPFLSRFQKYRFSLREYRREISDEVFQRVLRFSERICDLCRNYQMEHFSFTDLFANSSKKALEGLAIACVKSKGVEEAYQEAIRRLVLNSGQ
jgi:hypothetical protein